MNLSDRPLLREYIHLFKSALEIASAIFGLIGTWLMARRYAKEFGRSILFAVVAPLLFLRGRGDRVRAFVRSKISVNRDLPESLTDMVLGLNLLFWAFFLQLIALLLGLRQ